MPQDYKLLDFKIGDFKDDFGSIWCDAAFEGLGEPVRWALKDPSKITIGDSYYGVIEVKTSKAGKSYQKFKKMQREDAPKSYAPKKEWQPRDDDRIVAQWAIGQAVALLKQPEKDVAEDSIELWAHRFYDMVERVKSGNSTTEQLPEEHQDILNMFPGSEEVPIVTEASDKATPMQKGKISALLTNLGIAKDAQAGYLALDMGVKPTTMTHDQAADLITALQEKVNALKEPAYA